MNENIKIYIGYDKRESIAYHVCVQSIIDNTSKLFSIHPLVREKIKDYFEDKVDGSNEFIYSRFLVPYLCGFEGWALFIDGDMICLGDISELFENLNEQNAVCVVKHNYKTKQTLKYLGNKNEDYPRKNWSSVILWNCAHPSNKILTPEYIMSSSGSHLHRFMWIEEENIGTLDKSWNWLVTEYEENRGAKILHYTLGTPCFEDYRNCDSADIWMTYYEKALSGMGR